MYKIFTIQQFNIYIKKMGQNKALFTELREVEILKTVDRFNIGFTKKEIASLSKNAVENVLEHGNPLEAAEALKAMDEFLKGMRADKRLIDGVRDELRKYGKEYITTSGAKLELAETGTVYDFSLCCDQMLEHMERNLAKWELAIKDRKEFLKTVPISGLDIITEDGEVIRIYPPSKESTSSYKVELAK
jgi:hypothetical protein